MFFDVEEFVSKKKSWEKFLYFVCVFSKNVFFHIGFEMGTTVVFLRCSFCAIWFDFGFFFAV